MRELFAEGDDDETESIGTANLPHALLSLCRRSGSRRSGPGAIANAGTVPLARHEGEQ